MASQASSPEPSEKQYCGRCVRLLPTQEFKSATGAVRKTCNSCRDQINTQGRNKRAAARKQKADEALMEHLRNPPPIFPGSNIASITDIAGFANQTKAENEPKKMREDQDVTGDGFRTAGKDPGAKDGFTTTQSISRTQEQPKAAFAWGSLSISARPSIDPDAQS